MRSKAQRVTIIDMLCHLLSGAGLGAVLALALMRGNGIIADMIDESAAPKFLMLVSIAISSSIIAVGSSITGFMLTAMERD
jgi:hypothetical protein